MHRFGYAERYGSGMPRIIDDYRKHGNGKQIKMITNTAFTRVTLPNVNAEYYNQNKPVQKSESSKDLIIKYMMNHPKDAHSIIDTVQKKYIKDNDSDSIIINYLKVHKYISRKKVMKICHLGHTPAYKVLKQLTEAGTLNKVGKGRGTKYTKV